MTSESSGVRRCFRPVTIDWHLCDEATGWQFRQLSGIRVVGWINTGQMHRKHADLFGGCHCILALCLVDRESDVK